MGEAYLAALDYVQGRRMGYTMDWRYSPLRWTRELSATVLKRALGGAT